MTRIRRNVRVDKVADIERLMKSISASQQLAAEHEAIAKREISELYTLMKESNMAVHEWDGLVAERYRPTGRATNIVDPKAFRQKVTDDAAYYSAVTVSVTKARQVLPAKDLATITTTIPAQLGEETVRITKRGS